MKILTNPFEIYTEKKLLLVGLIVGLCTALVSGSNHLLLFGSLKVINNYSQSWYEAIINMAIVLISNSVVLFLFARIKYARTRFIDVLNVVLIAHIAVYIMLYFTALPVVQESLLAIELEVLDKGFQAPILSNVHAFTLGVFAVCSLSFIVYFFYLLVIGMKVAINSKSKIDAVLIVLIVLVWNTVLQFVNPFL